MMNKWEKGRPRGMDVSGSAHISMSPMGRDNRAAARKEIFRVRGMMPCCRKCQNDCKVLRGTPGMASKFFCYSMTKGGRP